MERKQFTFYGSFYRAMRKIKSKTVRADIFDAICAYALMGEMPDEDLIHPTALAIFEMARPVLDTAREKALSGCIGGRKQTGSKSQANKKQAGSKSEEEKETEKENEIEIERDSVRARECFDIFWNEFPKKTDKQRAWMEFQSVDVPLEVLRDGLRRQKMSQQWLDQGGRFVPKAADWLRDRRWEDQLPDGGKAVMGCSQQLGEAELAAIQKMLQEE